ncbi:hypothetical protein FPV67DRAFT_1673774 [Lyophyllum atratum]|nr:hypothetical protein FPV67DRAFT_1673774 [Lyophyllum atratum]
MNPVNPDSRPLPSGWNQHYDPSRNTWYYVCTNFKPPRVSTNHPLGPLPEPRSRPLPTPNVTSGMDRSNGPTFPVAESPEYTADPPSPRTSTVQPKASKLSFAQQLYASAAKPSQAYTPPTIAIPSIPTPPLSPPPNSNHRSMPIPPIPPFPSGSAYASGHYSASSSHNPVVSSQRPQSSTERTIHTILFTHHLLTTTATFPLTGHSHINPSKRPISKILPPSVHRPIQRA